jgi:hypothetical protein
MQVSRRMVRLFAAAMAAAMAAIYFLIGAALGYLAWRPPETSRATP